MARSPVHQALAALLRQSRLLGMVDKLQYYRLRRSSPSSRNSFRLRYGNAALPPDELAYDAYGFLNWEQYWSSGIETAQLLSGILTREFPGRHPRRLLEWGCGPARIVRHLPKMLNSFGWSVFASDCSAASVRWCRECIADVVFSENALAPPLPYDTASFEAVYAISVFTHLSEAMQFAWAKEMARILKEGGVLIASFHGDGARSYLLPSEGRLYDRGEPVVRGGVAEGSRTFVAYHPPEFLRAVLCPQFEILSRQTSPVPSLGVHDLYISRKRPG